LNAHARACIYILAVCSLYILGEHIDCTSRYFAILGERGSNCDWWKRGLSDMSMALPATLPAPSLHTSQAHPTFNNTWASEPTTTPYTHPRLVFSPDKPMMRASSTQKTYDEAFLACSTAVYFESQVGPPLTVDEAACNFLHVAGRTFC